MTYTLGSSFYLAWVNVFFFFMTGLPGLWCGLSGADGVVGIVGSRGRVPNRAREGGTGLAAAAGDSCRLGVDWGQAEGEVDWGFEDGAGAGLGQCGVQCGVQATLAFRPVFLFLPSLSLRSLLLSELHQLLVHPVTPGHMVVRHDNELTPVVCLLRPSADNPPHTHVM